MKMSELNDDSYFIPDPPKGDVSLTSDEREWIWRVLRDSLYWAKNDQMIARIQSIEVALDIIEKKKIKNFAF